MTEEWATISEFPDYEISSQGRVKNKYGNFVAIRQNQKGLTYVGLSKDRRQENRILTRLVASTFLPQPNPKFDTPIQLDGDRTNNSVDNLMWRPRWFAHRYHRQFHRPVHSRFTVPLIDTKTGEISANGYDCFTRYGLLETDLILAVMNRTYVWPTYQVFQILEE